MNSTNLNIVLTNALCCISAQAVKVSKLYSIGDKCADSELQKLKLMNDWFEALRCYTLSPKNSKFRVRTESSKDNTFYSKVSEIGVVYSVIVNGVSYDFNGDGVSLIKDLLMDTLATITNIISSELIFDPTTILPRYTNLYIEADCDVETIVMQVLKNDTIREIPLACYQQGYCTALNCLTETDYNTILAKLMKECGICECQLT